ncbi:10408_t:CDS:2 [Cetraspora pellucida]|uniref:10408_t:CDS:1 n=1 Tax=Cetraspora pellucida TaxID=1433469 RepID=A0ACA9NKQ0_9GLOM|nr:10408_t:CDS:2 [Cetraspora pellucida]
MNKRERERLKPFWNEKTSEISKKFWSHNDVIVRKTKDSWFNIYEMVSLKEENLFDIKFSKSEEKIIKNTKIIPNKKGENIDFKTCKIRLYPIIEEKKILKEWMRDVIDEITSKVPYDVRSDTVISLLRNIKINKDKDSRFVMKKRKETKIMSITIQERNWNIKKGVYSFLKNIKTKEKKPEIKHAVTIKMDRFSRFWLNIPVSIEKRKRMINSVLSIDPGVRTFITGYSPNGYVIEIGNNDIQKIRNIHDKCFKYQSIIDTSSDVENKKKRYRLRKKILKSYEKIRNVINDCHHKTSKYLCEYYSQILIPDFQYMTNIVECTEEYTSKTCGKCGNINEKLGSSKMFKCGFCNYVVDRDFNGARNILLKYLTENGFLHPNDY